MNLRKSKALVALVKQGFSIEHINTSIIGCRHYCNVVNAHHPSWNWCEHWCNSVDTDNLCELCGWYATKKR